MVLTGLKRSLGSLGSIGLDIMFYTGSLCRFCRIPFRILYVCKTGLGLRASFTVDMVPFGSYWCL